MIFTCFGEILWDVFPDRRRLGGAPLNVAYYLTQLGNDSRLISAVGEDELGSEALVAIQQSGLDIDAIARLKDKETGQVLVSLDKDGSASYEFKADAAWDYISLPYAAINDDGNDNHVLVFGSLAARSAYNLATLQALLGQFKYRVFDLNLRPPFDDLALCHKLMQKADLVKVNDEELALLCQHLGINVNDLEGQLAAVLETCSAKSICVTRGSEGAALWHNDQFYSHAGYPTDVVDTVGAGDAFLAGLVSELAKCSHPERALSLASAIGSLVAGQAGAQSVISQPALEAILKN